MYPQVIKYPCVYLVEEPDFVFESQIIQAAPGILMTFVHINVINWSKSTLKTLKERWKSVRDELPPIIYAQGNTTDAKWVKFVTHFGFKPLSNCICSDGKDRRIFYNISE